MEITKSLDKDDVISISPNTKLRILSKEVDEKKILELESLKASKKEEEN